MSGDEATFAVPNEMKRLRACLRCHLVKAERQFARQGCENCAMFQRREYAASEYTTPNFEGLVAVADPHASWISRHLNLSKFVPGTYALKLRSAIPRDILKYFEDNHIELARNPSSL